MNQENIKIYPVASGEQAKIDKSLLFVSLCLIAFGLVMVYSTTIVMKNGAHGEFLIRQLGAVGLGFLLVLCFHRTRLWRWARWARHLWFLPFLMLIIAAFGAPVNGAHRWIRLGGFTLQPSEFFKLWTILYLADFFRRRAEVLNNPKRAVWVGVLPVVGCLIMTLFNKDLGSSVVVFFLLVVMLFMVQLPKRLLASIIAVAIAAGALFVWATGRLSRFLSFSPFEDEFGHGAQAVGSLLSVNYGGLFGKGLGNGLFKSQFLTEAHNDFIFSAILEELGMVCGFILLLVYIWWIWRAFEIGRQARYLEQYFGAFVAIGVGLLMAAQTFVHVGVNFTLLPNKGLTLPFVSYGGTAMLVMILCTMLLLRVDYENRRVMQGYTEETIDPLLQITENSSDNP